MAIPLFVGIGAQKCASTWIYDILHDHPEVCLSHNKEIDFFSYHFGRGYQWYEQNWTHCSDRSLRGEVSPSYFCEPLVPSRLKEYAPDARIVVSLRDPVQRAISNHKHEVRIQNFRGPDLSFAAGLRNNPNYAYQGRYSLHLKHWLSYFPIEQLHIILLDDIVDDAERTARALYQFLNIDPTHASSALSQQSNESHSYRRHQIESLRKSSRQLLRRLGIDGLWQLGQRTGLQNLYRRFNRIESREMIPPVSNKLKNQLRTTFLEDIEAVERITGRNLSRWKADLPEDNP